MVAATRRPATPSTSSSHSSPGRRARAALVALGAVLGAGGIVGLAGPAQAASAVPAGCSHASGAALVNCTFNYTGAAQTFTVPVGISSVTLEAWGGHGGTADSHFFVGGGRGADVSGTFPVTPGSALAVTVAGDGTGSNFPARGITRGGYGYGNGGERASTLPGGGGGGSAVFIGTTPMLISAGGGGGGNDQDLCGTVSWVPGGGGGDAGHDGQDGQPCGSTAGGTGGGAGASDGPDGQDGAGFFGPGYGGGGGGGGYLGGGGGGNVHFGSSGGGGGGTSYADPSATDVDLSALSARSWGSDGQVVISFAAPDSTAPVAHPSLDEPTNSAGWATRAPVNVDWAWSDQGGQIDHDSCDLQDTASDEGTTTFTASCTDLWGNVGNASQTVKIDTTKPADAPVVTQDQNGTTVDWHWSDAVSGVDAANCQQQSTTSATFGAVLTSSCTDVAGNRATDSYAVQDTTKPHYETDVSPRPNAAGWNNTDVTVDWGWYDTGSGLNLALCTEQTIVTTEGAHQNVSADCTDNASNSATQTIIGLNIDKTKPVDSPVVTTTSTGASVAWNWTDALSGVDETDCTQSSSQTGTGQLTLTSSCTDKAGNTATDSKTVTVAPTSKKADVQVKITGPATGRTKTAYTYTVTTKDAGPGVASQVGTTVLLPRGATFVSASGSYTRIGPLVVWKTVPSLAVNSSTTYTIKVTFADKGTTGLAAASASLTTQDPNLFNNAAAVLTKVS